MREKYLNERKHKASLMAEEKRLENMTINCHLLGIYVVTIS